MHANTAARARSTLCPVHETTAWYMTGSLCLGLKQLLFKQGRSLLSKSPTGSLSSVVQGWIKCLAPPLHVLRVILLDLVEQHADMRTQLADSAAWSAHFSSVCHNESKHTKLVVCNATEYGKKGGLFIVSVQQQIVCRMAPVNFTVVALLPAVSHVVLLCQGGCGHVSHSCTAHGKVKIYSLHCVFPLTVGSGLQWVEHILFFQPCTLYYFFQIDFQRHSVPFFLLFYFIVFSLPRWWLTSCQAYCQSPSVLCLFL